MVFQRPRGGGGGICMQEWSFKQALGVLCILTIAKSFFERVQGPYKSGHSKGFRVFTRVAIQKGHVLLRVDTVCA